MIDSDDAYIVTAFVLEHDVISASTLSTTIDDSAPTLGRCSEFSSLYPGDITKKLSVRLILGLLYSTAFIVGLFLNTCVIFAVLRNRRLQSARNIFLLNLMLSDIILCLTSLPITPITVVVKEWIFGSFMCKSLPLLQSVSVLVTSWSLTIIALDKFIHIMDPTKEPVTIRTALAITTFLWCATTIINIPYALSNEIHDGTITLRGVDHPYGICLTYCDENWSWLKEATKKVYSMAIMMFSFVVPTFLISFCYWRIFAIVRRDMICDNRQFANSLSLTQKIEASRRKRRVNYILVAMVVTFIMSWAPMSLANVLRDFDASPKFLADHPYISALVCHYIAMTTTIWNPLLFYWLTRQRKKPLHRQTASMISTFGALGRGTLGKKLAFSTGTYEGDSTYIPPRRLISTPDGDASVNGGLLQSDGSRLQVKQTPVTKCVNSSMSSSSHSINSINVHLPQHYRHHSGEPQLNRNNLGCAVAFRVTNDNDQTVKRRDTTTSKRSVVSSTGEGTVTIDCPSTVSIELSGAITPHSRKMSGVRVASITFREEFDKALKRKADFTDVDAHSPSLLRQNGEIQSKFLLQM